MPSAGPLLFQVETAFTAELAKNTGMTSPSLDFQQRALDEFDRGGSVTLYHGTGEGGARRLLAQGKAGRASLGANGGQPELLYVTTHPENALWFARQGGGCEVLEIKVPARMLQLDPEDGIGMTVRDELESSAASGTPASFAVRGELDAALIAHWSGGLQSKADPFVTFLRGRFGDRLAPDGTFQAENFAGWFHGSACVEEDGRPKLMFHGTTVWSFEGRSLGDIEIFERTASVTRVRRRPSIDTIGSWFSDLPGESGAEMYSSSAGAIYPVYLRIQDPWVVTFDSMCRRARRLAGLGDQDPISEQAVDALRHYLKETGRDGIRLLPDLSSSSTEFSTQTCWIALEAQQVKSAVGNCGSYRTTDAGISDPVERERTLLREAMLLRSDRARSLITAFIPESRVAP